MGQKNLFKMLKNNKIKIYTHHGRYLNASSDVNKIKNNLWNKNILFWRCMCNT